MVMGFQTQPGQPLYTLAGLASRSFVTEKFQRLVRVGISGVIVEPGLGAKNRRRNGISVAVLRPGRCFTDNPAGEHMAAQQQPLDVLQRVQGEYIEMPGLRLTTAQAQRLWGLDRAACDALLAALVDAKFLFRTRDGAFVRSDARTHS